MTKILSARMTVRQANFADLFSRACEGGINYWARVTDYHWSDQDYDRNHATLLDTVAMLEYGKPAGECAHQLTAKAMSRALRLISEGHLFGLHQRRRARFAELNRAAQEPRFGDAEYDVTDADVLAQVTLFGGAIYT